MVKLPFYISLAALDPSFSGTPGEFADHMAERMAIVGPSGFYGIVVSDTEPTSNQGLWLKAGTQPYVWDEDSSRYVPMDVTDSVATLATQMASVLETLGKGKLIFSASDLPPSSTDRTNVIWVPLVSGVASGLYSWNTARSKWMRIASSGSSFVMTGGTGLAYTGSSGDPDITNLDDLLGRFFAFQAHADSQDNPTFQYSEFSIFPLVAGDGTPVKAGQITAGSVFVCRFDGALWRVLSPLTDTRELPTSSKRVESALLAVPNPGNKAVFDHGFTDAYPTEWCAYLVLQADNAAFTFKKDDLIDIDQVQIGGDQEELAAFGIRVNKTSVIVTHVLDSNSTQRQVISDAGTYVNGFIPSEWKLVIWAKREVFPA